MEDHDYNDLPSENPLANTVMGYVYDILYLNENEALLRSEQTLSE